jgi:hypothetical protein
VNPTAWSIPLIAVTVGTGSSGMVRVTELVVTERLAAPTTEVMPPLVSVTDVTPVGSLLVPMVSVVPVLPNDKEQLAADACPPAVSSAARPTAKTPAMRKKRGPHFMPRTPMLCPDGFVGERKVHVPARAMFDRSARRGSRGVARQPGCRERCQSEEDQGRAWPSRPRQHSDEATQVHDPPKPRAHKRKQTPAICWHANARDDSTHTLRRGS